MRLFGCEALYIVYVANLTLFADTAKQFVFCFYFVFLGGKKTTFEFLKQQIQSQLVVKVKSFRQAEIKNELV